MLDVAARMLGMIAVKKQVCFPEMMLRDRTLEDSG